MRAPVRTSRARRRAHDRRLPDPQPRVALRLPSPGRPHPLLARGRGVVGRALHVRRQPGPVRHRGGRVAARELARFLEPEWKELFVIVDSTALFAMGAHLVGTYNIDSGHPGASRRGVRRADPIKANAGRSPPTARSRISSRPTRSKRRPLAGRRSPIRRPRRGRTRSSRSSPTRARTRSSTSGSPRPRTTRTTWPRSSPSSTSRSPRRRRPTPRRRSPATSCGRMPRTSWTRRRSSSTRTRTSRASSRRRRSPGLPAESDEFVTAAQFIQLCDAWKGA